MRAFIAIDLPLNVKNAVLSLQNTIKINFPEISWVKPQNLHLTLKFLANITLQQLEQINLIISAISHKNNDFKIRVDDLGTFPDIRSPRIIWAGISQDAQLKQIVRLLEEKIANIGIEKEKRQFSAHITIARIKSGLKPVQLEEELKKVKNDFVKSGWEFNAGKITLFESTLGTNGPTYTVLKEANFKIN